MTLYNPSQVIQQQSTQQYSNAGTVTEYALTSSPSPIAPDRTSTKNRKTLEVFNDGTSNALIALGTTISATAFTAEIYPGGYYEISSAAPWQGPITMRSTSSPTNVNVTETTII